MSNDQRDDVSAQTNVNFQKERVVPRSVGAGNKSLSKNFSAELKKLEGQLERIHASVVHLDELGKSKEAEKIAEDDADEACAYEVKNLKCPKHERIQKEMIVLKSMLSDNRECIANLKDRYDKERNAMEKDKSDLRMELMRHAAKLLELKAMYEASKKQNTVVQHSPQDADQGQASESSAGIEVISETPIDKARNDNQIVEPDDATPLDNNKEANESRGAASQGSNATDLQKELILWRTELSAKNKDIETFSWILEIYKDIDAAMDEKTAADEAGVKYRCQLRVQDNESIAKLLPRGNHLKLEVSKQ